MISLNKSFPALLILFVLHLAVGDRAHGEDIDLFTGVNPAGGDVPTILLYMHNKRNTNANVTHGCTYDDTNSAPALGDTVGGFEQCAIVNALLSIKTNTLLLGKIKVGILLFNNSQFSSFDNGDASISNGAGECGYLAYVPTVLDATGIDLLVASMKSYADNSFLVPNTQVGDGMVSAWAILNGLTDTCGGNNINYSSLAPSATDCGDAAIIHIGNLAKTTAKLEDKTPTGRVDSLLQAELTSKFGYASGSEEYQRFTAAIPVTQLSSSLDKYQADDWARFMKRVNVDDSAQADRNIVTYSIGIYDPGVQSQIQDQFNFMGSMAKQGGGKFYTVEHTAGDVLKDVLLQIFTEVQAVNSVFSSATLPVSASTQGTFLNQVYIATFRPDRFAGPRWYGNVKQYQFAFDASGQIVLADKDQSVTNAVSATNPNTGGFSDTATSFWTTNDPNPSITTEWPSTTGYWVNSPDGEGYQFDAPDGDLVEKGGAGQRARIDYLKSQATRKVLSCASASTCGNNSGTLVEFTPANFDETALGLNATGASGTSPSVTIGSALPPTGDTLKVDYTCDNQRNCTFKWNAASTIDFPDFFLSSGNGQNAVPGDAIGLVINGVTPPACTPNSPCTLDAFGVQNGVPFFTIRINDNSFRNITVNNAVLTTFRRYSAHASVAHSGHGYSAGDIITLESCVEDSGGTHINSGIIATGASGTFQESVDSVASPDAFTIAVRGNGVAISTGITCSGGATSSLSAANLVNWVRGEDNAGNEVLEGPCPLQNDGSRVDNSGGTCDYTVRPSIHGDVLHSRPAVINFGDVDSDNGDDVVLFYGSNDGMFRAINGNQTRAIGSVKAGSELWSFVAPEFFSKLPRLFKNFPRVNYPGSVDADAESRDYFFDGSTAFLQDKRTVGETAGKVYLYLTPRRGGKFIYALDVTSPTTPAFLWKKTKSDFAELGQFWSQPKIASLESYKDADGHTKPVLIFGAGYDADVEDQDPAGSDGTTTDEGRGIVVLDAKTGDLVWTVVNNCAVLSSSDQLKCVSNAGITRSMAADIRLFDNDFNGLIDRLYAADTAGNIWRVDIPASFSAASDWTVSKFASLGGTGNNARKFLFPPNVLPSSSYDIIVAVSGDREKPLYNALTTASLAYNVENRFYLLLDRISTGSVPTGTAALTETDLLDRTGFKCYDPTVGTLTIVDCTYSDTNERYENDSGDEVELVTLAQIAAVDDGFYMTLRGGTVSSPEDSEGEKGVNAPSIIAGKVYFATNQPAAPGAGSCNTNLGIARGYEVDLYEATSNSRIYQGGGMPATSTFGLVEIGGKPVPFGIGTTGEGTKDPDIPGGPTDTKKQRTYWFYK